MIAPLMLVFAKYPELFALAVCQKRGFFGLPVWWKYLEPQPLPPTCEIPDFDVPGDIWLVLLAGIEMLLWFGGMIAVVMVIVGGFRFMSAMGNTEKMVTARKTIINAMLGLAIIAVATVTVSFIGNYLAK
ncbi:hypothetical protein A3F38_02140 [Candidatus Saccharibacteria bacterium RIFCSPHIGHO2_12_FULL_48_21]|nr:MAG: hypothetical protein A3F38_02140 [Candidatus Saccharibacteria bacterium RIFCSPHIGHO2_12_FULL_48_21]